MVSPLKDRDIEEEGLWSIDEHKRFHYDNKVRSNKNVVEGQRLGLKFNRILKDTSSCKKNRNIVNRFANLAKEELRLIADQEQATKDILVAYRDLIHEYDDLKMINDTLYHRCEELGEIPEDVVANANSEGFSPQRNVNLDRRFNNEGAAAIVAAGSVGSAARGQYRDVEALTNDYKVLKNKYRALIMRHEGFDAWYKSELELKEMEEGRNHDDAPATATAPAAAPAAAAASPASGAEGDVDEEDDDDKTAPILSPVKSLRFLKSDSPEY